MVNTTRRSSETYSTYETTRCGVGVLERPQEYTAQTEQDDYTKLKAERQANLEKLLNYDRYTAENMSAVVDDVVETTETTETAVETTAPVKDFLDEETEKI